MFCTKCGSEIQNGAKFCTKCGAAAVQSANAQSIGNTQPEGNLPDNRSNKNPGQKDL